MRDAELRRALISYYRFTELVMSAVNLTFPVLFEQVDHIARPLDSQKTRGVLTQKGFDAKDLQVALDYYRTNLEAQHALQDLSRYAYNLEEIYGGLLFYARRTLKAVQAAQD